jgi:hypothetical protein
MVSILLGNDREITPVTGQQFLDKRQLNNNRGTVFSVWSLPRFYNWDGLRQRVSCKRVSFVRQSVKRKYSRRSWEPAGNEVSAEAEESPLLEDRYQETTSGEWNWLRTLVCVEISDSVTVT